jgi:hypothetical protein
MANEIVVQAVLDTTDLAVGGVARAEEAGRRIKQVLEEQTAVSPAIADQAGQDAGQNFLNGILKRMLLRDVIRTAISGLGDIFVNAGQTLGELLGTNIDLSLKGTFARLGDSLGFLIASHFKTTQDAAIETSQENIEKIKSDEKHRIEMDQFKENPLTFNKSSKQIEQEIEAVREAEAQAKIKYEASKELGLKLSEGKGVYGAAGALAAGFSKVDAENELKVSTKNNAEKLKDLDEQLAIAKKKEELLKQIQKDWDEETKQADREAKEKDKKKWENIIDTAFKQREIDKKIQEQGVAKEIASEEVQKRGAEADLSFSRHELDKSTATSAVSIRGGLFGRNDSAAALVQHAAQQVNILRSIDQKIGALRQQSQELTLQ